MTHVMPQLPYGMDALSPYMSKETSSFIMVNICKLM